MKRRDLLKAAAVMPVAAIVPDGTADAAQAIPAVHPDDIELMREIEAMEATLARLKGIVGKAAAEEPFERAGLHCDARCTIGALHAQVSLIDLKSDEIYIPLVRRIRDQKAAQAPAAEDNGLTPADYRALAESARKKREALSGDSPMSRFQIAYLLRFEETMHQLAADPAQDFDAAFAADAQDRVALAQMFGITL